MSSVLSEASFETAIRNAFDTVRLFKIGVGERWETVWKIPLATFRASESPQVAKELLEKEIRQFVQETNELSDWLLTIPPLGTNGFALSLSKNGLSYRILFGELEEEFDNLEDALTWVSRGLSETYRLRITMFNGKRRQWTLEPINSTQLGPVLESGHLVPFRAFRSSTSLTFNNCFEAPAHGLSAIS